MIGTAVVLMAATGRIPVAGGAIVLGRDIALVLGYKLLAPRGLELEVTFLGKLATWILYAALGFLLVTPEGTTWPLVILWIGIVSRTGSRRAVSVAREERHRGGREAGPGAKRNSQAEVDPSDRLLLYSGHTRKGHRWNHCPISPR